MHELLKHVLTERDLTRAGDIFAIPDADIVDDLNEVVSFTAKYLQLVQPVRLQYQELEKYVNYS